MTGFCGGMSRTGALCGALTGGIAALGLIHGRDNGDQEKKLCYTLCYHLTQQFEDRFGSRNCAGVIPCDISTAGGTEIFMRERFGEEICHDVSAKTAAMVQNLLNDGEQLTHPLV